MNDVWNVLPGWLSSNSSGTGVSLYSTVIVIMLQTCLETEASTHRSKVSEMAHRRRSSDNAYCWFVGGRTLVEDVLASHEIAHTDSRDVRVFLLLLLSTCSDHAWGLHLRSVQWPGEGESGGRHVGPTPFCCVHITGSQSAHIMKGDSRIAWKSHVFLAGQSTLWRVPLICAQWHLIVSKRTKGRTIPA